MQVFLDNAPLAVSDPTLRSAFDLARARASERGRLIIEVRGDGLPIDAHLIDDPPDSDAGLGELRFLSADPGAFVRETLLEARGLLPRAKDDQDRAAALIQSGALADALEPLQRVLDAWMVVRDVVERSAQLIGLELGVEGEAGAECVRDLAERLTALKRAVTEEDWSAAADELAYEMDGLCARWETLLTALADQAAPRR